MHRAGKCWKLSAQAGWPEWQGQLSLTARRTLLPYQEAAPRDLGSVNLYLRAGRLAGGQSQCPSLKTLQKWLVPPFCSQTGSWQGLGSVLRVKGRKHIWTSCTHTYTQGREFSQTWSVSLFSRVVESVPKLKKQEKKVKVRQTQSHLNKHHFRGFNKQNRKPF